MNEAQAAFENFCEHADELGIQIQFILQGTPHLTGEELAVFLRQYALVRQEMRRFFPRPNIEGIPILVGIQDTRDVGDGYENAFPAQG